MRVRPLLLATAVGLAAAHVLGILAGDPLLRYAEVLALLLLLGHALAGDLPAPRWVLPTTLAVLVADAVRTIPPRAARAHTAYQMLAPADGSAPPMWLQAGVGLIWAALTVTLLLLVVGRRLPVENRRPVTVVVAAVALLLIAYPTVRIVEIAGDLSAAERPVAATAVNAVAAVSLPVILGLAAIGLAAVLVRRDRRIAATGAVLLAVAALPHVDMALGAVPLPYGSHETTLVNWADVLPSSLLTVPLPAWAAAAEMAAYVMLVAGLTRFRPAVPG